MGFDNPVVGGNTLIRQAIQSPNYQPGTTGQGQGWAIKEDGSAEFNNLTTNGSASGSDASYDNITANDTLTYQGQELTAILEQYPLGIVGFGTFIMPVGNITTKQFVGGMTWHSDLSNRIYRFSIIDMTYTGPTFAAGHGGTIGFWNDGNNIGNSQEFIGNVGDSLGHTYFVEDNGNIAAGDHTFIASLAAQPTTDTITTIAHTVTLIVEDLGPAILDTGFIGNITGTTPAPTFTQHSFQINATDSRSYIGSGVQSNGSGASHTTYMYFGEDPGFSSNGNWRSYAFFDNATLSAMAGYHSLTDLEFFIEVPWWYQVAGGTLYVGWHGNAAPGSVENIAGGAYAVTSANFTGRGQTKWINLTNVAAITNAIQAGTFKGIVLGPGPDTSFSHYGYANGSTTSLTPKLKATYYK